MIIIANVIKREIQNYQCKHKSPEVSVAILMQMKVKRGFIDFSKYFFICFSTILFLVMFISVYKIQATFSKIRYYSPMSKQAM